MNRHIFVATILLCLSVGSIAETMPDTSHTNVAGVSIETHTSQHVHDVNVFVKNVFSWLNQAAQRPVLNKTTEVEQYFHPNLQYFVNGKLSASNSIEFMQRHHLLRKQYKSIEVSQPILAATVAGNEFAVTYKVKKIDMKGIHSTDQISAFVTVKENRVTRWYSLIQQVATA